MTYDEFLRGSAPRILTVAWNDWIRTVEVEPSLYAADFARLGEQIDELLNAGARVFHYDVGDGHFVEPITIGPIVLQAISGLVHERGGVLDCHLMVDNPERHIPQIARAGGDSVTFHVEVTADPGALIAARPRARAAGRCRVQPGHRRGGGGAARRREPTSSLCMSIRPRLLGPGVHARGAGADRAPARAPAREADPGRRRDRPRTRSAPRTRPARTCSSPGSAIFGHEDLPRAYRRLVQLLA